jgi:hypothetical protein
LRCVGYSTIFVIVKYSQDYSADISFLFQVLDAPIASSLLHTIFEIASYLHQNNVPDSPSVDSFRRHLIAVLHTAFAQQPEVGQALLGQAPSVVALLNLHATRTISGPVASLPQQTARYLDLRAKAPNQEAPLESNVALSSNQASVASILTQPSCFTPHPEWIDSREKDLADACSAEVMEAKAAPAYLTNCELTAKAEDDFCGAVSTQGVKMGSFYFEAEVVQGTSVRIGVVSSKKMNGGGCERTCSNSHSNDGNCLVCGRDWGPHNGHDCTGNFSGQRGSWRTSGNTGSQNIGSGTNEVAWDPISATLTVSGSQAKFPGRAVDCNERIGCIVSVDKSKITTSFVMDGRICGKPISLGPVRPVFAAMSAAKSSSVRMFFDESNLKYLAAIQSQVSNQQRVCAWSLYGVERLPLAPYPFASFHDTAELRALAPSQPTETVTLAASPPVVGSVRMWRLLGTCNGRQTTLNFRDGLDNALLHFDMRANTQTPQVILNSNFMNFSERNICPGYLHFVWFRDPTAF